MPETQSDTQKNVHEFLKKPRWLHRPTRSDLTLMIISLITAFFIWVYIATNVSGNYSLSFRELPITVDITNSRAAGYGLSVLAPDSDALSVDVTVSGSRANIGGLNRNDLEAYVDFNSTSVTDTIGRQTLPVRVRAKNGATLGNVTLSVSSVDVTLDKYQTREIPVGEVLYPNLTGSDEEVVIDGDGITYEPSSVMVYGPSASLAQIDYIRINLTESVALSQTKTFTNLTDYTLIAADGSTVSATPFSMQNAQFSVKVPVYYTVRLPLTVDISTPSSSTFNTASLLKRMRLTTDTTDQTYQLPGYGDDILYVSIKTDKPQEKVTLDKRESWALDTIPVSSFALGSEPIKIDVAKELAASGYEDSSNLGTVEVSLDETDLVAETRWISNSDIVVINGPSGYDCTTQAGRTRITIIGERDEVAQVNAADIKTYVNLFNAAVPESGTFEQALTIVLPDTVTGVWAAPLPKVNITATPSE